MMSVRTLTDDQILLGKFTEPPGPPEEPDPLVPIASVAGGASGRQLSPVDLHPDGDEDFPGARQAAGNNRGQEPDDAAARYVGRRIGAEVFLGPMFGDAKSLSNQDPEWRPALGGPAMRSKDFVRYALASN